ncbi:hypothetical protein FVE85_0739 [Porphyridium purpureum]|uniref:SGNH hydrolase-type esterase domain-containing protein n=1 Tax=Porphyridium purpureum TaxID=35688 RepID=A0A5J4Z171_PORPP|nr:hypothetical protein FVE85_0739 [Porphyridium purpureum]|eukprot:POR0883..scf208_2
MVNLRAFIPTWCSRRQAQSVSPRKSQGTVASSQKQKTEPDSCPTKRSLNVTDNGNLHHQGSRNIENCGTMTRILCYGDSLTAGFCHSGPFTPYALALKAHLETLLCDSGLPQVSSVQFTIDVHGASGVRATHLADDTVLDSDGTEVDVCDTAYDGLRRALEKVPVECNTDSLSKEVSSAYKCCLIMAGTNDLADIDNGMQTVEVVVDSLVKLHTVCHLAGVRTIALSIPPNRWSSRGDDSAYSAQWTRLNALLKQWANGSTMCDFVDVSTLVPYDEATASKLWEYDGLHMNAAGYNQLGHMLAPYVARSLGYMG